MERTGGDILVGVPSRSRALPLLAGLPLLVAVACGGSGDGVDSAARTTAPSVTTTVPGESPTTAAVTAPGDPSTTAGGAGTGSATTVAPATATTPAPTSPPTTARRRVPVAGFGEIAFRVQGTPAQRCALLAETENQRQKGLMQRTDLSGYDGMLFLFPSNETGGFWMFNTPLPLSIAWFDGNGRLVSTADMTPCVNSPTCPSYFPTGAYRSALEVPQGGLGALGIGPGAVISFGGACA